MSETSQDLVHILEVLIAVVSVVYQHKQDSSCPLPRIDRTRVGFHSNRYIASCVHTMTA